MPLTHCQVVFGLKWSDFYGLCLPPIEVSKRSDRIVCFLVRLLLWLVIFGNGGWHDFLVGCQRCRAVQAVLDCTLAFEVPRERTR